MVSTKKVCKLARVYSLLVITRNHFNTFLLLDLQKNGIKVKYCSKCHLLWNQDFARFRQVAVQCLF